MTTRSTRRDSMEVAAPAPAPPIVSEHPSSTPIDANTLDPQELIDNIVNNNQVYLNNVDFVDMSDMGILCFYPVNEQKQPNNVVYPPLNYRRTAKHIRKWVRFGNTQKETILGMQREIQVERNFCSNLTWNGDFWVETDNDDEESASSIKSDTNQSCRCGCKGVTLELIGSGRYSSERLQEVELGFKQTCREGMVNRAELSRPSNDKWKYCPPVIGTIHNANTGEVRWTVEEHQHSPEDDQYQHISIHHVSCEHEKYENTDDPAAAGICEGCRKWKERLLERFNQQNNLRTKEFDPSTRRSILTKSGSLQKKHTNYHQRRSKTRGQKISRMHKYIDEMIDTTGVNVDVNNASGRMFSDESMEELKKKFKETNDLSQDSIALYAFERSVHNHKVAQKSGKKAVRHCPLMIRLGALVQRSLGYKGELYDLVAKIAGFPSGRTIRRYTVSNSNDADGIMHDNCKRARDIFEQKFPDANQYAYERNCCLAFDSMHVKQRLGVGRNTNEIVAIDTKAFDEDVIKNELDELVAGAKQDADDDDETKKKQLPDIAKHFLVFIATTWTTKGKIQFLVAREGKLSLKAHYLKRKIRECITALAFYGFIVDTIAGDGASENRSVFKLLATISAREILSDSGIFSDVELEGLPLDFKIAFPHPNRQLRKKGMMVVIGGEMPHWVKKFRNAFTNKSRTLTFGGIEMNIDQIYQIWLASGDATGAGVRKYHFTHDHFKLNAYLKMRVFLAVQIPSETCIEMIEDHCKDDINFDGPSSDINQYKPMIKLFKSVDRLVDIVNGVDFKKNKKRNVEKLNNPKHRHIFELFDILRVFEEWKKECNGLTKKGKPDHGFNGKFITRQTYEDLVWMVFGYAAHAALYLREDGSREMHQGRGGSDVCEHLFSLIRYINSNPNMQQAREGASKVSGQLGMEAKAFNGSNKGNSGTADMDVDASDLLAPIEAKKDAGRKRKQGGN